MPDTDTDTEHLPVLRVSDGALELLLGLRADEDRAESLALWVEISGVNGDAYGYEMYFQESGDAGADDWTGAAGDLALVIPGDSVDRMRGALLDLGQDRGDGMVIQNPNRPPLSRPSSPRIDGPPPDLSGDTAQRILQVLERQINPAIAAHGGRADLVAVEDDTAYLRLSGGCAGCGLASVTLSQGIEVALREAAPEIERVVDVTDHAAGTNPYYEAAKK